MPRSPECNSPMRYHRAGFGFPPNQGLLSYLLQLRTRKTVKRIISNRWIFWILLFYIFLAALHFQIDPGEFGYTDDLTFLNTSRTKTVFTWVSDLYNTWGGRITVDTAFYYVFNPSFGVVIWRLVNPLNISTTFLYPGSLCC